VLGFFSTSYLYLYGRLPSVISNIAEYLQMETLKQDDVIKKEARGLDGFDLGEVQEVTLDHVLTQKGIVDRKWYQIPKNLVKSFDGSKAIFNVTEDQSENYFSSGGRGYERI
jgi:hypothetical protein